MSVGPAVMNNTDHPARPATSSDLLQPLRPRGSQPNERRIVGGGVLSAE